MAFIEGVLLLHLFRFLKNIRDSILKATHWLSGKLGCFWGPHSSRSLSAPWSPLATGLRHKNFDRGLRRRESGARRQGMSSDHGFFMIHEFNEFSEFHLFQKAGCGVHTAKTCSSDHFGRICGQRSWSGDRTCQWLGQNVLFVGTWEYDGTCVNWWPRPILISKWLNESMDSNDSTFSFHRKIMMQLPDTQSESITSRSLEMRWAATLCSRFSVAPFAIPAQTVAGGISDPLHQQILWIYSP